ncbi:sigma-54 interaction domain-containing protein [Porticoccus sp.]
MSAVAQRMVVFGGDVEDLRRVASLVNFLEYRADVAVDEAQLLALVNDPKAVEIIAVLITELNDPRLTAVLDLLTEQPKSLPIYFLQRPQGAALPAHLEKHFFGTLDFPPSYSELVNMVQETELFMQSSQNVRVDQFGALYKHLAGNSQRINHVREMIKQVAATDATVLILGESGTGKEVVARNTHRFSTRADKPFVPVNCGAIPPDLLESELFGHEKGSFTGAISARQGRFEIADGGTLFLDEIGDMPLSMQVKLLRVIQERTFERVGSSRSISVDVRIIAATHHNLEQLVTEGKFRMDLYYRLNVFPIEMPPLRERVADIPILIREFINKLVREKRGALKLNECAVAALCKYYWPGNVRELSNLIERLSILYPRQTVKWSDLPERLRPNLDWIAELGSAASLNDGNALNPPGYFSLPPDGLDLKTYLTELEVSLLTQALEQCGWVVARAAKLLELQRTTLVEKMRKFNLSRPDETTNF